MLKKSKNKGITLIALVITIIVMLILAAISIAMLTGDNGILNKAVLAKEATRGGEVQEKVNLAATHNTGVDYTGGTKQTREEVIAQLHADGKLTDSEVSTLEENDIIVIGGITIDFSVLGNGGWEYNHATQTVTATVDGKSLTLKIGDRITGYESPAETTYSGDWRVLGEEDGKLLIVTETAYAPFDGEKRQIGPSDYGIILSGDSSGVNNAIDRLNQIGEAYVNPQLADSGRSIKLEDINKITGYDPTNCYTDSKDLTIKGPCFNGSLEQYGNTVTYTLEPDGVSYTSYRVIGTNGNGKSTRYEKFIQLGNTDSISIGQTATVKSTGFLYYIDSLAAFPLSAIPEANRVNVGGLDSNSPAYDMITKCINFAPYWLASSFTSPFEDYAIWGLCDMNSGGCVRGINGSELWRSNSGSYGSVYGVRPVITLKSNVKLIPGETDEKGITNFTIQV